MATGKIKIHAYEFDTKKLSKHMNLKGKIVTTIIFKNVDRLYIETEEKIK